MMLEGWWFMKISNHFFPRLGAFFFEHGLSTRHEQIAQFREMGLTSVQIADPLMKELVANPSQATAVAKDFREAGLDIAGVGRIPKPDRRRSGEAPGEHRFLESLYGSGAGSWHGSGCHRDWNIQPRQRLGSFAGKRLSAGLGSVVGIA
jgi:hypothetical protein